MKPRLLDLFSGAGGAAMGYARAGFEVVGVDISPQPNYPFEFVQADALEHIQLLIAEVRELLKQTGLPYVIENVVGARSELRDPYLLTGEMFGLRTSRPRLFETNWTLMVPKSPPRQKDAAAVYGKLDGRRLWTRSDGSELRAVKTLKEGSEAMGIDWMTWDELREAIPPAYCELVGAQLLAHVRQKAAA